MSLIQQNTTVESAHLLRPPETNGDREVQNSYLETLADRGVEAFLRNGRGLGIKLYPVGPRLIPVIVSDGLPGKASILSPTGRYLDYPLFEIGRRRPRWQSVLLGAALSPLRAFLRQQRFDKVAYVNHWLLPSNPTLSLRRKDLTPLVRSLIEDHPEHALIFSGIVPSLTPDHAAALVDLGGVAIPSRVVHLVPPQPEENFPKKIRATQRTDARLREDLEAFRLESSELLRPHARRLHELYSTIYLARHPGHLNCQYSLEFFDLLLQSGICDIIAWQREGRVEAFDCLLDNGHCIESLIFGIDPSAPEGHKLFRALVSHEIAAARRRGLILNLGGGNDAFKRFRGAQPHFEYEFVFHRHLPARRLPAWSLVHNFRLSLNRRRLAPVPSARRPTGEPPDRSPRRNRRGRDLHTQP